MADEFEAWMGKMGVSSKGSSKDSSLNKSSVSSRAARGKSPKERHLETTKSAISLKKEDPLTMGLEDLAQSSVLQRLKEELVEKEVQYERLQEQLRQSEEEKGVLLKTIKQKEEQLEKQQLTIHKLSEQQTNQEQLQKELHRTLFELQELQAQTEKSWQAEKELRIKEKNEKQKMERATGKKSFFISLLEERGIMILEEQLQVLQLCAESANFLSCFQTLEADAQQTRRFLTEEIHLIGEHIAKKTLISGMILPVSSERCELTRGLNIEYATREIITEMLMSGLKKMAIIGTPKVYDGLLRELFTHESIIVSILGFGEVENLSTYDIVVILNDSDIGSLSQKSRDKMLRYSLTELSLGEILLEISKQISHIPIE